MCEEIIFLLESIQCIFMDWFLKDITLQATPKFECKYNKNYVRMQTTSFKIFVMATSCLYVDE